MNFWETKPTPSAYAWSFLAALSAGSFPPVSQSAVTAVQETPINLMPVAPAQSLRTNYGLGVMAIPDPPAWVRQNTASPSATAVCPVDIRTVVGSVDGELAYAVVVLGEQSWVLSPGESVHSQSGRLKIRRIEEKKVFGKLRDQEFSCELAKAWR